MKVQELTKTEFLKKVANYEASPTSGCTKETNLVSWISMPPGADLVRWSLLS